MFYCGRGACLGFFLLDSLYNCVCAASPCSQKLSWRICIHFLCLSMFGDTSTVPLSLRCCIGLLVAKYREKHIQLSWLIKCLLLFGLPWCLLEHTQTRRNSTSTQVFGTVFESLLLYWVLRTTFLLFSIWYFPSSAQAIFEDQKVSRIRVLHRLMTFHPMCNHLIWLLIRYSDSLVPRTCQRTHEKFC